LRPASARPTRRHLGEEQGLAGIGWGESLGEELHGVVGHLVAVLGQQLQRARAVGLGQLFGRRLPGLPVVLVPVLGRPVQGELQVDPGHGQDASPCAVLVGVLAIPLPEPGQDRLREGSLVFIARGRPRLPRRRRLAGLEQRDRQVVGVAVALDAGESITVMTDERILGARIAPFQAEAALRVGAGRDRLRAVATVVDRRAGDRLAIGADHAACEVSGDVQQRDLAEVVRLAGLAGGLGRLGLAMALGLDRDLVAPARPEVPEDEPARLADRVRLEGIAHARPLHLGPIADVLATPRHGHPGPLEPLSSPVGHHPADPEGILGIDREPELALDLLRPDDDRPIGRRRPGPGPDRQRIIRVELIEVERAAGPGRDRAIRHAESIGFGLEHEHLGPDDRLSVRIDDDAVEPHRMGELQVGPGPIGGYIQLGAFVGIEPEIVLRHGARLDLERPRPGRDRVTAVRVGLGLVRVRELATDQEAVDIDTRDPLAGLGVDDAAGDGQQSFERHLEFGDGVRADL
jgi:hypothetical protein